MGISVPGSVAVYAHHDTDVNHVTAIIASINPLITNQTIIIIITINQTIIASESIQQHVLEVLDFNAFEVGIAHFDQRRLEVVERQTSTTCTARTAVHRRYNCSC